MRKMLASWLCALSLGVATAGCNSHQERRVVEATAAPPATRPFTVDAKQTLYFLASDELEGRGIGTRGLDRAADFIADDFRKIGLKTFDSLDGYFQPFEMTTATEVGPGTMLAVDDRKFEAKKDFLPANFSAEAKFAGPVVFAGYGIKTHHYDDYTGVDVKGKVVLAMRYEPHDEKGNSQFEKDGWSDAAAVDAKAKAAQEAGAAALLVVTPPTYHTGEDALAPFARRRGGEAPKISVLHVRQTIAEELLHRGGAPDLKDLQAKIDKSTKPASFELAGVAVSGNVELKRTRVAVKNVIGYVPGKVADEYVVVGAHYDHLGRGGVGSLLPRSHEIHNGADDNASGTTAMLELASHFAKGPAPQRSIIFVAFTAEEEGIIGSKHFVDHPPVPLEKIDAMINLDMVGRIRSTPASTNIGAPPTSLAATSSPTTQSSSGILYVGGSGTSATFDGIIRQADEDSPLVTKDIGKGGLGPSDHMSFALKRIPVLFFFSGLHADYHRPTDDAAKINYIGLGEVVDFTADVIKRVAAEPRQPYVASADAHSMRVGSPTAGGVKLGVVPDYSTAMDAGGGVKISGTAPDSPAAKAGLKEGDLLVSWDGKKIDTLQDLSDFLANGKPNQPVKLGVKRGNQTIEMDVTLVKRD